MPLCALPAHSQNLDTMGWGGGKGNCGVMQVLQSLLGGGGGYGGKGKGGKGNRGNMGMISRTAKTNPERVAWIGGLEGKTLDKEACKKLKDHIEKLAGEGCKFVSITNKGAGGAIFGSGEEAQQAIAAVNGSKFMGKTLEVDVWTKKEK